MQSENERLIKEEETMRQRLDKAKKEYIHLIKTGKIQFV